jgi:hypothetical protein
MLVRPEPAVMFRLTNLLPPKIPLQTLLEITERNT